jgi:hypothetical protein
MRFAFSVSPVAALRLAPKEDFTPNAQRKTIEMKRLPNLLMTAANG